jgi:hypothetical protein
MAFLDFIRNHNAVLQQSVAQTPQPQEPAQRAVESLPDYVKAQAVEAARPAAELMEKATQHRSSASAPSQLPPSNVPARGRALGWER